MKESHYRQILRKLQTQSRVSNFELYKITPRYSARLHELRNDGYEITMVRDQGTIFSKPQRNRYWLALEGRFEISSRE